MKIFNCTRGWCPESLCCPRVNYAEVHPEGIQPCNMKYRHIYWRRYKKHCTQDNDASVPFKVGTLGPHTVLPVAISCPIVFSWIPLTVWSHPSLSKVILVLGKARSQIWAVGGLSHLGDLMFCQKTLHKTWCMCGRIDVMKLPITSCP